jgi:hypothetical protein
VLLVAAVCLLATIGSAPPASANHPGCFLDGYDGWYTDNQNRILVPAYWINWGAWDSTGDYIARRYDGNYPPSESTETYKQWRSGDEGIHWATTSGEVLHYRFSAQQRAGYGWRQHGFSVYHCDPR